MTDPNSTLDEKVKKAGELAAEVLNSHTKSFGSQQGLKQIALAYLTGEILKRFFSTVP